MSPSTAASKQPSARRTHLLAGLRQVGDVLDHPLLDLGGSRSVALSPTHLEIAQRGRTVVANIDRAARPDLIVDAHVLPFADGSFRTILLSETLEHLSDPVRAVGEIHRLLRPGGGVVVTVPFAYRVHGDPDDYQRYTASGLRVLFGDFEIERIETQGGPWSVIACVLRDLLYGAKPRWMPFAVRDLLLRRLPRLVAMDRSARIERSEMVSGWTTGYLLVARRG